jgi:hypothetical protein
LQQELYPSSNYAAHDDLAVYLLPRCSALKQAGIATAVQYKKRQLNHTTAAQKTQASELVFGTMTLSKAA